VWGFALPDEIHCRGDIYNNSLAGMRPELEMRYYQLARQHRFQPGVVYYRPKLETDGAQVRIDWSDYDGRLHRYLDGSGAGWLWLVLVILVVTMAGAVPV
jgi:hypothetical protein